MEKVKTREVRRLQHTAVGQLFLHPKTQAALKHLLLALVGFILAGGRFGEAPLPWAVCLVAALGCSVPSLCVYLGAVVGSFGFWQTEAMLFTVATGFLTLIVSWALMDLSIGAQPYFAPLCATLPGLLVGFLLLMGAEDGVSSVGILVLQCLCLSLGTVTAQRVLREASGLPFCFALFALVSGCGRLVLPGSLSVGAILACGALLMLHDSPVLYPAAVLLGLALDWSWMPETSCTAALCVAVLVSSALGKRGRFLRYIGFVFSCGGVILLTGGGGSGLFLAAILGGGMSFLLPPLPTISDGSLRSLIAARLHWAESAMEQVYRAFLDDADQPADICCADVYAHAADKVCAICARRELCWQQDADRTYAALKSAEPAFLVRKQALREDFPPEFRGKCRLFSEFLLAMNEALCSQSYLLSRRRQRRELRTVVGEQYRITSDFLRRLRAFPMEAEGQRFAVHAAVHQRAKGENIVTGDAVRKLNCDGHFYLLLCDGMGTGKEARDAAVYVLDLLSSLLRAGMPAEDALQTLNCVSILRENGGLAAVDLVEVNLINGEGVLYKWGAGPSYLLCADGIRKMGTATLPPGVGVGGTHRPQCIGLSLGRGEALILTSDGVGGEDALTVLRQGGRFSPEELAAGIVGYGYSGGEDDGTAVVLKLEPVSAQ